MNEIKLLWLDCETTGLDTDIHEIIQLAGIIESPGNFSTSFNFRMKPLNVKSISKDAIAAHGISVKEMLLYKHPYDVYLEFKLLLNTYVNKYDKDDKLILSGQNVKFDDKFIRAWFEKYTDTYWGSYVTSGVFDLKTLAPMYEIFYNKKIFSSYSLGYLCKKLEVELTNAHDAKADIIATRECCLKIYNEITKDEDGKVSK